MTESSSNNRIRRNNAARTARYVVGFFDSIVNFAVLAALVLLLAFGVYAIWDSQQIQSAASRTNYEIYKPSEGNTLSFDELRRINPEVIGWLTVYGTDIDYPLVQSSDNLKYINTSAEGNYSLSGSIFLDSQCAPDFSDYVSVIHGHNMQGNVMFGQLKEFENKDFFDTHLYGNLFFNGRNHGLKIFEYFKADAYDNDIYGMPVTEENKKNSYVELIESKATRLREAYQKEMDNIVLLSTCALGYTNGRDIIACVLTDETFENSFEQENVK